MDEKYYFRGVGVMVAFITLINVGMNLVAGGLFAFVFNVLIGFWVCHGVKIVFNETLPGGKTWPLALKGFIMALLWPLAKCK